jgi:hypothetical protein
MNYKLAFSTDFLGGYPIKTAIVCAFGLPDVDPQLGGFQVPFERFFLLYSGS